MPRRPWRPALGLPALQFWTLAELQGFLLPTGLEPWGVRAVTWPLATSGPPEAIPCRGLRPHHLDFKLGLDSPTPELGPQAATQTCVHRYELEKLFSHLILRNKKTEAQMKQ